MIRILVADDIAAEGIAMLKAGGIEHEVRTGQTPEQLAELVGGFDGVLIRSGVKITKDVLKKAGRLKAIARAGVGVDNVDVPAATAAGVLVMNTPDANTVSAAEHTVTLMMAMSRDIHRACSALKAGKWDRKSFVGRQLCDKTLGVVGLGRIGRAVAERAVGLQMKIIGFDPFFSGGLPGFIRQVMSLDELLPHADYITVHTPMSDQTKGIIGKEALAKCKKGVFLMNVARGGIIDEAALAEAIKSGHVAGAGLDVFVEEPPKDRTLIDLPQVLCTPHLGASTVEAQTAVSTEAVAALLGYLQRGEIRGAVNLPAKDFEVPAELRPYLDLAGRMGRLLSPLCVKGVKKIEITYRGQLADKPTAALTGNFAAGLLQPYIDSNLNVVNVGMVAKERGIAVSETRTAADDVISTAMEATVAVDGGTHAISGAVFRDRSGRILSIDGYPMEMKPAGNMVLLFNRDQPGVIGRVGTIFGKHKVNIANMTISRLGEKALMVLNIDSAAGKAALDELGAEPAVILIREVALPG